MADRAQATKAPTTVKVGGRTFRMSPMTDEDIATMDQWIRARHVRIARATLSPDATDAQRELTESVALRQASSMTFMSGAGAALMGTPEALAMLFWCGIRHNHPEMTPEAVRELLFNPDNLDALQAEWDRMNLEPRRAGEAASKKKKAKRKAAAKSRRRNR
jgi:hypothetical protein